MVDTMVILEVIIMGIAIKGVGEMRRKQGA